ncbi:MAG: hypothetical protein ACE5K0_09135 [Candidatus Methanofastidiosia archaeon]
MDFPVKIAEQKTLFSTERCPASPTAQEGIDQANYDGFSIINHPKSSAWDWKNTDVILETGNYIAYNNYALKACELYRKAIELLERILGLWG